MRVLLWCRAGPGTCGCGARAASWQVHGLGCSSALIVTCIVSMHALQAGCRRCWRALGMAQPLQPCVRAHLPPSRCTTQWISFGGHRFWCQHLCFALPVLPSISTSITSCSSYSSCPELMSRCCLCAGSAQAECTSVMRSGLLFTEHCLPLGAHSCSSFRPSTSSFCASALASHSSWEVGRNM